MMVNWFSEEGHGEGLANVTPVNKNVTTIIGVIVLILIFLLYNPFARYILWNRHEAANRTIVKINSIRKQSHTGK